MGATDNGPGTPSLANVRYQIEDLTEHKRAYENAVGKAAKKEALEDWHEMWRFSY